MSSQDKHANSPPTVARHTANTAALAAEEKEVRALLARGSTKPALEQAKKIHKQFGTPVSEALLLDAYRARIHSLLEHGLTVEAKALLELVEDRYPASKSRVADMGVEVAIRQGNWAAILAALNAPNLPEERRTAIASAVCCQLTDLSTLAECTALAPEHPWRAGAAALAKAFEAVTSGPVTDDALGLPEVSHRGPLGPWKMLVRAIAYFYRHDDAACARCLEAIPADSVPARWLPAMRTMLSHRPTEAPLSPAAVSLLDQAGENTVTLRAALETLHTSLVKGRQSNIIPEIQRALSACRTACPEILERLRQHITILAAGMDLSPIRLEAAMGGPAIQNAYFWRLCARFFEGGSEEARIEACSLWEQFRQHAVAEGWFREDGPEAAALYLRMADLLSDFPAEELRELREEFIETFPGYAARYRNQPPAVRAVAAQHPKPDYYYLYPEQLFARACTIDPHREAFEKWLEWARQAPDWRAADGVAENWRRALPKDSAPLLFLMESAEKRESLSKAMGFLEQAEKLDALNPQVRRAALRLLVAQVLRYLRQRKAGRAEQKVQELEALPQAQEADRPAFLAALRWAAEALRDPNAAASRQLSEVSRLLGSPAAARLICRSVAEACQLEANIEDRSLPEAPGGDLAESLAGAVARACTLADDMNVPFTIPVAFEEEILKELSDARCDLEARQLRALGEAALRHNLSRLAYAASAAGLRKGGATEARFLLLRARALPRWEPARRRECLAVAAELASRQRDMALVEEAVDLERGRGGFGMGFLDSSASLAPFSRTTAQVNAVLEREKEARDYPKLKPETFDDYFDDEEEEEDESPGPFDQDSPEDAEGEGGEGIPLELEAATRVLLDMFRRGRRRRGKRRPRRVPARPEVASPDGQGVAPGSDPAAAGQEGKTPPEQKPAKKPRFEDPTQGSLF